MAFEKTLTEEQIKDINILVSDKIKKIIEKSTDVSVTTELCRLHNHILKFEMMYESTGV